MPRVILLPTMISMILALIVTSTTPLTTAAAPSDAYGVGCGADELEPQTPRALELAILAYSTDWSTSAAAPPPDNLAAQAMAFLVC